MVVATACSVTRTQQFRAVLRKNFLLQVRGRKAFLGLEGWAALLAELLIPAAFFVLMCLPRHYLTPSVKPQSVSTLTDLDNGGTWGQVYDGALFASKHKEHAQNL